MTCNSMISGDLTRAVLEQTDVLEELGGFTREDELIQYVRDVRDVVRKLRVAESLLGIDHVRPQYASLLLATPAIGSSRG